MSAALAKLRARVQAKENAEKVKTQARIVEDNKQWVVQEAKEREEQRDAQLELRRRKAAEQAASAAAAAAVTPAKRPRFLERPAPKCGCSVECVRTTVAKEGPMFERPFFACEKGRKEKGGCSFFEWIPEDEDEAELATLGTKEIIVPNCKCGDIKSVYKVVKTEGANLNRPYFACEKGKKEFGGCDFFAWAAEAAAPAVQSPSDPQTKAPQRCRCGLVCPVKQVSKEGPNFQKPFFTCPRGRKEDGGCNFFEWAPEGTVPAAGAPQGQESAKCRCGTELLKKTVAKEGPNFGKTFLACATGRKENGGCGFFEWSTAVESPATAASGAPAAPPLQTGNAASGVCFRCKKPGHFASSCPSAGSTTMEKTDGAQGAVCFRCKKAGHYARVCPLAAATAAGDDQVGEVRHGGA